MASLAPTLLSAAVPYGLAEVERQATARTENAAADASYALERESAERDAATAEEQRQRSLADVLARQRTDLAARGLDPDGANGNALRLGLIDDSLLDAQENSDRLSDRIAQLDLERENRRARSLLDRDRLLLRSFGSGLTGALTSRF